jgi:hypothetical protein
VREDYEINLKGMGTHGQTSGGVQEGPPERAFHVDPACAALVL